MKMENPDEKMYKMTDVTQRSIDINKPHFDSLEVANAISKREQSVLTAAALKYSKMKGIKDPQDEIEALKAENEELKAKLDKAKWQPIETAPKDIKILMGCWFNNEWYEDCGTQYSKNGRRTICVGFRKNEWPTHWMPLPDAPEQR